MYIDKEVSVKVKFNSSVEAKINLSDLCLTATKIMTRYKRLHKILNDAHPEHSEEDRDGFLCSIYSDLFHNTNLCDDSFNKLFALYTDEKKLVVHFDDYVYIENNRRTELRNKIMLIRED